MVAGEISDFDIKREFHNPTGLKSWCGGFCFALFWVWGLSAIFLNSPHPMVYDDEAGFYVHAPGAIQHRSEGWGETVFGEHGSLACQAGVLNSDSPKVVLWGDSFVEAVQVDDDKKISVVFNRLKATVNPKMISFGASGFTMENYLQAIPGYEKEIPGISKHFVFLSGLGDVRPDSSGSRFASFFKGKESPVLLAQRPGSMSLRFSTFVRDWRLNFLPPVFRSLRSFYGRPVRRQNVSANRNDKEREASLIAVWTDMFLLLKQATGKEVVFVYAPPVPLFSKGAVDFENSEQEDVELFQSMCLGNGVGFVDLTKPFEDFYQTTGRFPRGFFNSPPGQGHLNADGQKIVAQVLDEYLSAGAK